MVDQIGRYGVFSETREVSILRPKWAVEPPEEGHVGINAESTDALANVPNHLPEFLRYVCTPRCGETTFFDRLAINPLLRPRHPAPIDFGKGQSRDVELGLQNGSPRFPPGPKNGKELAPFFRRPS